MSTFRRRFALTLDGERLEVTTSVADYLAAEQYLGKQNIANAIETAPMQMQMRVVFGALSRTVPEHPVARDWPKFVAALDDLDDLDAAPEEAGLMDPTRAEDSASWP